MHVLMIVGKKKNHWEFLSDIQAGESEIRYDFRINKNACMYEIKREEKLTKMFETSASLFFFIFFTLGNGGWANQRRQPIGRWPL